MSAIGVSDVNDRALEGKVAIVTGGAKGLGRAMSLGLVGAGARVAATGGHDRAALHSLAADAENIAGAKRVLPILANVTSEADCQRVVDETVAEFGGIDILVNNAGIGMRSISNDFLSRPLKFWQADGERWRALIDTNVNGPFLMARSVVPHLIERGAGRIVNISMNRATMQREGFSPYGPSKAALESATVIWAKELSASGITVNSLLPGGATMSGMIPDDIPDAVRANLLDPEILVPPLIWLCSDSAGDATGGRYLANTWDLSVDPNEAAARNRSSAGWSESDDD